MPTQFLVLLVCMALALATGACTAFQRQGDGRPSSAQLGAGLPQGSTVDQVVYADLTGDGRDEALVATTVPNQAVKQLTAFVFSPDRRGTYRRILQRRLRGDIWLPTLVGRAGEGAPLAAVFLARGGNAASLSYIVVQQHGRVVGVTMENASLLNGSVRFVPEGLLESRGDTDRLLRWADATWQTEDLYSQYLPPLPAETIPIAYTVDAIRGPMTETPRVVHARVGQHLFLRRMDRGDPSRVQIMGSGSSYAIRSDGVIYLQQPDTFEIHIEGPAYSGRTLILSVRVEQ
ncbi:MAG: hypothetical protein A2Z07_01035 [Armatimonadetes bacterium RBG_16_67_12]|nr:MAG: hypothetical protein A2Z07_01035 [Armatimonadetes bacterium RBG_16_67_12]